MITRWETDKVNGKHWVILCDECETATHAHRDYKVWRCEDCGMVGERPKTQQELKILKRRFV